MSYFNKRYFLQSHFSFKFLSKKAKNPKRIWLKKRQNNKKEEEELNSKRKDSWKKSLGSSKKRNKKLSKPKRELKMLLKSI